VRIPARSYSLDYRTSMPVAALLVAALALRAPLLAGGQIDYDEGVYWQSLRALAAGHPLFTSVYSSQPPAFLLLLLPVHLVSHGALVADRAAVLVLALAGVAAAGRTAGLLAGRWAGLLAAALLAADPLYLRQSVTLQADGPAVALALIALAAAAEARRRGGRPALGIAAAAGAVLALAVLTKLVAAAAAPALLGVLLRPAPGGRRPLALLACAALSGVVLAAAALLPFAPAWPEAWRQVVGLHLGARSLRLGGLDGQTVAREAPIAILGVLGGLVAARRAPALAAAGGAWAAAAALLLAVQHPLWPHHVVVLTAPLALLGGGLALALPGRVAAVACVAVVVASVVPAVLVRAQQVPPSVEAPVTAALRSGTAPRELVVTDDQFAASLADRDVPPGLVDTSYVRVASGDLSAAEVEAVADEGDVHAVLLATGRLAALPGFRAWVDLGDGRTLYLRPANDEPSTSEPLTAHRSLLWA
jgi:4-amino-4-deoxy-L-arabinose transferase-like glycosyltransferase